MQNTTYLQHHGILGQKWGKKNGPPYPLAVSSRSAVERKANGSRYTTSAKERYVDADYREIDSGESRVVDVVPAGKAIKKTIDSADELTKQIGRTHRPEGEDLSNRSTEDLKKEIDRMQTEQRYHDLKGDQINRGAEHVHEVLQTSGIATSLIVSGLETAVLIGVLTGKLKLPV